MSITAWLTVWNVSIEQLMLLALPWIGDTQTFVKHTSLYCLTLELKIRTFAGRI